PGGGGRTGADRALRRAGRPRPARGGAGGAAARVQRAGDLDRAEPAPLRLTHVRPLSGASRSPAARESAPEAPFPLNGCTAPRDRKSTRLNSSHVSISYAVF